MTKHISESALSFMMARNYPFYLVDNGSSDINRVFRRVHEHFKGPWVEDAELVVAGCSFTAGDGVPEGEAWGERLASLMGVESFYNISRSGWNMDEIVGSIITYIQRSSKKPKYVAVLATELTRYALPLRSKKDEFLLDAISISDRNDLTQPVRKYDKYPYNLAEIITPEVAIYQSLSAISTLIDYCELSDIKLVWGTWDPYSSIFYEKVLNRKEDEKVHLGNYINLPTYMPGWSKDGVPEGCHNQEQEIYKELFYMGSDSGKHSGIHHHIHWAEEFHRNLTKV